MGGRGSRSATGSSGGAAQAGGSDRQLVIEALQRAYDSAKDDTSLRGRDYAEAAETALYLAETDIGAVLVRDSDFKDFRKAYLEAYTSNNPSLAIRNVNYLLTEGASNRPMHLEPDEWVAIKEHAAAAWENLYEKGYTFEEVAAGNGFYDVLSRLKSEGTVPGLVAKKGKQPASYTTAEKKRISAYGMEHFGYGLVDTLRFLVGPHNSYPGY